MPSRLAAPPRLLGSVVGKPPLLGCTPFGTTITWRTFVGITHPIPACLLAGPWPYLDEDFAKTMVVHPHGLTPEDMAALAKKPQP